MNVWTYGATIEPHDGDFVVSVRDLPEVVTSGSSMEDALSLAYDAVEVAVAGRMGDDIDLPQPTAIRKGERPISLPAQLSAKAAVYAAWKAARITRVDLARLLDRDEAEIGQILNPRHGTRLDRLEHAARALGGRLVVSFENG